MLVFTTLIFWASLLATVNGLYMNGLFSDHAVLQLARPDTGTPQARLYGSSNVTDTIKDHGHKWVRLGDH